MLELDEALRSRFHRAALVAYADNQRVLAVARRVGEALSRHDIATVAIKGTALVGPHAAPEHRRIGDIDLVVPLHQVGDALRAMTDVGLVPPRAVTPLFHAGRHAVELRADDGTGVDLHWRFAPTQPITRRSRRHPSPAIFDRAVLPVSVDLGGIGLPCVEDSLVITAMHGCRYESAHVAHLAADAHVLMTSKPDLDWGLVDRTAHELGHRARVASWLTGVVDDLGTQVDGAPERRRAGARERIATIGERAAAITSTDDPSALAFLLGWAAATTAWAPWRAPSFVLGQLAAAWELDRRRTVLARAMERTGTRLGGAGRGRSHQR